MLALSCHSIHKNWNSRLHGLYREILFEVSKAIEGLLKTLIT